MADNSKFVLRWEIDNTTVVHAAGKAEPKVFYEEGFIWTVMAVRDGDYVQYSLRCGVDHSGPWKCEANLSLEMLRYSQTGDEKFVFCEYNDLWRSPKDFSWNILIHPKYAPNNCAVHEFNIHIIASEGGEPIALPDAKFADIDSSSNVILKIGDKKLHVSKEFLAEQSPVFKTMFFGDFAEKGKEEVEIKDVVYEEFVDLLNVIYLVSMEITDRTVLHILKLADQFQMKRILAHCLKYLTQTKGIDVAKKLSVADQYGYFALKKHCLNSFSSIAELTNTLKKYPEVNGFSDEMKAVIFNLTMKLKLQ